MLIIGSGFSNWLARFFIRLAQNDRLWMARGGTIIADQRALEDDALLDFLRHFSSRTRVFQASAANFVEELAQRWTPQRGYQDSPAPSPVKSDAVFISYASEDRTHAEAISNALEGAQIPVWYDREQLTVGKGLGGGDQAGPDQVLAVRPHHFQELLDATTALLPRGMGGRREDGETNCRPSRDFVIPVAVDDTSPYAEQVKRDLPEIFRKRQWERLPNGKVTPEFVEHVKELFRQYKLSRAAS